MNDSEPYGAKRWVHVGSNPSPRNMMNQNRQDTKDRMRSELDYNVNLKAELEIGELLSRVGRIEQRLGHFVSDRDGSPALKS
jgi:uncharacterized membrane protein